MHDFAKMLNLLQVILITKTYKIYAFRHIIKYKEIKDQQLKRIWKYTQWWQRTEG